MRKAPARPPLAAKDIDDQRDEADAVVHRLGSRRAFFPKCFSFSIPNEEWAPLMK